ncbi:Amidase [Candidatus Koribacter versatilis Ellin345]|uniref:Amidase n=1 Tax=Koribacter versatilis (strain Ellin345) TaxID=204669 RepID=Q1ISX8_KORVE|nr:amidase family protein [Candidatus Koribacter versatilis]ABF40022.1 Amidase [Candidatus Koribacter versatilis Ellin345]
MRLPRLSGFCFLVCAALLAAPLASAQTANHKNHNAPDQYNEATLVQLQHLMNSHQLNSEQLTRFYLARIDALDQNGPGVNAVIQLNPDALNMAKNADRMRRNGVRGPMLGIPVLLKDNIDTGDKMQTAAGSFALVGAPAFRDSTVAANLRAAGAVILGKTNLSEWANFRSFESVSGWSGRGGQTNNPYAIDRNPCGSSSGSAAAVSANFTAVSLGTETDGSIVCPANANGVVGIKPTVGLTSRAGAVPISHTQDTVGVHGRTVADAAAALGIIQSRTSDGRDPATGGVPLGWQGTGKTRPTIPTDYTQFLDKNGLNGATIGVTRVGLSGFTNVSTPQPVLDAFEETVQALEDAGATVIDLDAAGFTFATADGEFLVLCFDFRNDLKAYLATRFSVPIGGGDLQTAIDFNNAHPEEEMPFFNQDIWDLTITLAPGADDPQPAFGGMTYNQALAIDHNAGVNGIDAAISMFHLDAVFTATDNPAWSTDLLYGDHFIFGTSGMAAGPGYPIIQVPGAMPKLCASPTKPNDCTQFGVPLGVSFFGTAFSEPTLIKLASGFEAVTKTRAHNLPTFADTEPFTHIQGTTLKKPHKEHAYPANKAAKATTKSPHKTL